MADTCTPGTTAIYTLHAGRFTSTAEVTVVGYYGYGLWTVRDAAGCEFRASERELTPVTPKAACSVCRDAGIVQCSDPDGTSVYETACPEPVHDGQSCPACGGNGYVEGPGCNCGVGPAGYYGMHERYCGLEPCPLGCPFVALVASQPEPPF